ncbi:hypothetical protein [Cellulomonas endophytica]|uniref:hypothetical protein n=1 Tax=Cellulomonas endophytica TaxID=2494735 RepID=UPI0010117DF2|nr:hypothetical protein [Cellulomonas endophytica]
MSATLLATPPVAATDPAAVTATATATETLRGVDAATGRVGTWHLVAGSGPDAGLWVVEHVAGHVMSDAVWMQTAKDVTVLDEGAVLALRERVRPCC